MRRRPFLRPIVLAIALAVLLLHGMALWWAHGLWQPRSQIKLMAEPVYARLIQAKEPAALPRPRTGAQTPNSSKPRAAVSNNDAIATRPLPAPIPQPVAPPKAAEKPAAAPEKIQIPVAPAAKPLFAALGEDKIAPVPEPVEEIEPFASAVEKIEPSPRPSAVASVTGMAEPAEAAASQTWMAASPEAPASALDASVTANATSPAANGGLASTSSADVYQDWPNDTRINVKITGYFRGKVTGSGSVTWQREAEKYQAQVKVSFGLGGFTMTSQGAVTDDGLLPKVFEENIVGRLRSAHFEDDAITIGSGKRIPRAGLPGGLGIGSFQDSASQFVELSWRFATGRATLAPGSTVSYWLGRPEGLYQYIYDISGPEPMDLPKFGTVSTWHLTPRPIPGLKPDAVYGEIWIAPSLQYLPVKIRMRNAQGVYLDLLVDTMEQSDSADKLQK